MIPLTHQDVDRMLIMTALVERVMEKALPRQHRSNWPIELIRESYNTAFGYTAARSRYQPNSHDIDCHGLMHDLLVEARGAVEADHLQAVIWRYRLTNDMNGIENEQQLMPWREVAQRLGIRSHVTAMAWADEVMQWMAVQLNRHFATVAEKSRLQNIER